jgi:cephalosporin hydroxylase
MWMMQQILAEIRPDYVIETGTMTGGSALYYAHVLQGLGLKDSKVITIDIRDTTEGAAKHPIWQEMVEFVHASSTDPAVVEMISEKVSGKRVVVTLDSLHDAYHVLEELKLYSPLVSPGSYIVAEDTILDSISIMRDWAGPGHAVIEFLATGAGADFEADIAREAFPATLHPGGWLRKK